MNWYRVLSPHNSYGATDVNRMVLLEGGEREAALELAGYLKFVMVHDPVVMEEGIEVVGPVKPKKLGSRRGKQVEAGPPESEPVEPVSGDELGGGDSPQD